MNEWDVVDETPQPAAPRANFADVTSRVIPSAPAPRAPAAPAAADPWAVAEEAPLASLAAAAPVAAPAPQEGFLDSVARRFREQREKGFIGSLRDAPADMLAMGETIGRGLGAGYSDISGTASLLFGMPGASLVDLIGENVFGTTPNAAQDYVGRQIEGAFGTADRLMAEDPRAANPENQVLGSFARTVPDLAMAIATGGESAAVRQAIAPVIQGTARQNVARAVEEAIETSARASVVPAANRGSQLATDVIDQGGSALDAAGAFGSGASATALTNVIPASASGSIVERAIQGLVSGAPTEYAQTQLENVGLPEGMQQDFDLRDAIIASLANAPLAAGLGERGPGTFNDPVAMRQFGVDEPAPQRVQPQPQQPAANTGETPRGQAEVQTRPGEEARQESQAVAGSDRAAQVGSAWEVVEETPAGATPAGGPRQSPAADPLAPRAPAPAPILEGDTRDTAVEAWRQARTDDERAAAAARIAAFDARDAVQLADDADGGNAGGGVEGAGLRQQPADTPIGAAARATVAGIGNAPRVEYHSDGSTLPENLKRARQEDGQVLDEALFDPNSDTIHIITNNIESPQRAEWVATHEVAHSMLRSDVGRRELGLEAELASLRENPFVEQLTRALEGDRTDVQGNRTRATEEAVVELMTAVRTGKYEEIEQRYGLRIPRAQRAGVRAAITRLVQRVKAYFDRKLGRSVLTDADVFDVIQRAWREEAAPGGRVTSRGAPVATRQSGDRRTVRATTRAGEFRLTDERAPAGADFSEFGEVRIIEAFKGDEKVGQLLYANDGTPPTIEVEPAYRRQGVATAMLKLAREQGGVLGTPASGMRRDGGRPTYRTDDGQAFRENADESTVRLEDDVPASRPFERVPDSLMGFRRGGPNRPFDEQNYRHTEYVRVTFDGGNTITDAVKGLNASHALERARRNWPTAEIASVTKAEFDADEPVASRTTSALLRNLTPAEQKKITDKVAAKVIDVMTKLPPKREFAAAAHAGRAKRGWYAQSAKAISDIFGGDAPLFAGLLAATSPQVSVQTNLNNALKVWREWNRAGRPTDAREIEDVMAAAMGGRKSVLDAWVNNTVRALTGQPLLSGPKVDSFMRNLLGNVEEVTNDAWMANFSRVNQTLFKGSMNIRGTDPGKGTGYLAMNARVRETARELTRLTGETWTPAEVQETVWSWAKTLTELADSAGEIRNAEELVLDRAITDELVNSTPDFGTLLTEAPYASILEESGYGDRIEQVRAVRNAAREAGQEPAARREAGPFAPETQLRLERSAARRIDQLRKDRLRAEEPEDVTDAEDYIPFSRRAANPYGQAQGEDLQGLPVRVRVGDRGVVEFHGYKPAQDIARRYAERHGNQMPRTYAAVDEDRARRIAAEYDRMEHAPQDPEVQRSYRAMIDETVEQYRDMLATGLQVEFITGDDPYTNGPRDAILDVVENNHLWVYPTRSGFGTQEDFDPAGNPLLEETEFEISGQRALANDVFRAVHDYFGHIANGVGFRADGEENAWREHSAMYSPLARRAMTSETRGQNSWLNYGPHGEANRTAKTEDTVFADQKTGLMPEWVSDEGRADDAPVASRPAGVRMRSALRDAAREGEDDVVKYLRRVDLNRDKGEYNIPYTLLFAARMDGGNFQRPLRLPPGDNGEPFDMDVMRRASLYLFSAPDPDEGPVASRAWTAKKKQPDAVEAVGYHYSNTPDLKQLDPARAGSGGAGRERRRFGIGTFGKQGGNAARVAFYVSDDDSVPAPEDVVRDAGGEHLYRARLGNLYDLDSDPRGFVEEAGQNQDYLEELIADAGFDGFLAPPQPGIDTATAVVFDIGKKKVPVQAVEQPLASRRTAQVDTPEFRRWFGDSKVVDDPSSVNDDVNDILEPEEFDWEWRTASVPVGDVYSTGVEYHDQERAASIAAQATSERKPIIVELDSNLRLRLLDGGHRLAIAKRDGATSIRALVGIPEQIKSATANSGEFDPGNQSITASRRTPQQARQDQQALLGRLAAQGYTQGSPVQQTPAGRMAGVKEAFDAARTALQDKMLPGRRALEAAGAVNEPGITAVNIDDAMNFYRLENLMYGRAKRQLDDAETQVIRPMQAQMRRLNLSPEVVMDVMLATHAPERNAKVASLKGGMQDGAAGITTADARAILAGTKEGVYSGKKLTADEIANSKLVWNRLRKLREQTIDNMVEAGQIDQKLAATLRAAYKDYVPLRGKDTPFDDVTTQGTGSGLQVGKPGVRRALGRGNDNLAKDILGEIVGDYQRSVVAKEKARAARALLRFAMANPNPDLYEVEPVDLEWKYSEATGEAYLGVKSAAEDATENMLVRIDGKPVRIKFKDPALRDAALNMGAADLGKLVHYVGAINRWRSAVLTRFNPAFTPINVMRDLQFGLTALAAERGVGAAARAAVDYMPSLIAMYRDTGGRFFSARGDASKPNSQKTALDWAAEASEAGMKTGLTQVDDTQDLQRRMSDGATRLMTLAAQGRPWALARESVTRAVRPLGEAIERINDATENALRLAAYIGERKRGRSTEQAAEYAKNLTINFNRKGQYGPALNAIYLFYNAAIQGTHAVQRVMRNPKVMAYLVGMAGLQAYLALSMMEDDDDLDGITAWDTIPDYVKRTSLVIPLGGKDYFALPMPYGFNLFPYMGGRIAQRAELGQRPTDSSVVGDVAKSMTEAFSPVPVADGYGSLFGDQIGFAMSLAANKDDLGREIAPTDPYAEYEGPRALEGRPSTARPYHVAAQLLAKAGGGNLAEREPPIGYLDVAPEQIEEVVNYLGGGLAGIGNKSLRWWENFDASNFERPMDMVAATPIASRLVGTGNVERAIADRYYGERGEFARERDLIQDRIDAGMDPAESVAEAARRNPSMAGLEVAKYKGKGKSGQKPGDVKRTASGNVQLQVEKDSTQGIARDIDKAVTAQNRAIRQLRSVDITNEGVVRIVTAYGKQGRGDKGFVAYTAADLGLPEDFTADAPAPTRIRNRAIKLVQEARASSQQGLLRAIFTDRSIREVNEQMED